MHAACPDVDETMKWSFPHFQYKGMLCSMAAFKEHCAFGFWKGSLIVGEWRRPRKRRWASSGGSPSSADLPSKKVLTGYIKQAMKLNDDGREVAESRSKPKAPKPALAVPDDLTAALAANHAARATFEKFSPSHKREYVEWITEAKTEATRTRRLETALEWMAEGKPRNWKYMNC